MDELDGIYSIKSTFNVSRTIEHNHENISEEFARYFSIDDDIVLLDQSEIIFDEVKIVLDQLLNKIQDRENHRSQILNFLRKHSLDFNHEENCLPNKKVRFNIPDDTPSTHLFVSETLQSTNPPSKPYDQFLYNLGFDLCLEQNLDENAHHLSETNKQTLIKHNHIFHQYPIYSCKYCSFQTNTIHVMNYHYRTPHIYHHDKYRCTYCSFRTFRLSQLRRHLHRKHHCSLISEPSIRRYQCVYCSYETDEKNHFFKHNKRCQIEQTRTCLANNLLAPSDHEQVNRNINSKTKTITKNTKIQPAIIPPTNNNEIFEPILIESDHDSSSLSRLSSSDEDFIVSSDEDSSFNTDNENSNNKDFEILTSRSKPPQQFTPKPTKSIAVHPIPTVQNSTTLSSLSKLLLLNGSSIPSFNSSPYNANKTPLIPIQPKPIIGADVYQMCNICQCYIFKNEYAKHMNEKHQTPPSQSQQSISTPIIILNTPAPSNSNTSITCLKPTLILSKDTPQPPATIFLLSTSNMNRQLVSLNMIKCPWCDTNFEHIDIMTGHLMRYHRMTLAAAKVVVAEQMKIQGTSSNELSHMFKLEIEQIQKEFTDKIYWKISQPKVYLHQIENFSCFVCHVNVDDIDKHFLTAHQIPLATMNTIKQCCLCGFHCDLKTSNLFEHQLRTHAGVCYSSTLKQFIRFEPPPPPLSRTIITKNNNRLSSHQRALTTHTDKKFGCRKCATSSVLFTFEELVEHLRIKHEVNVKLHRRCLICQQTYLKGKEYNQHCLEHFNDENPSIKLQRKYKI